MPNNALTLEVEKLKKEFYESMRKLDDRIERQSKLSERTDKQLGRFVNSFGDFVENLAAPSIPSVMEKCGINVIYYSQNALSRKNGKAMEIDVLAYGKTKEHEEVVLLVEIKSTVALSDVNELVEELKGFPTFFPAYKGKSRMGVIAGIKFSENVMRYAEKKGLFVLTPSKNTLRVSNSKGFKPKVWK